MEEPMMTPREFEIVRKYYVKAWVRQIKTSTLKNSFLWEEINECINVFRFSPSDLDPVIEAMREKIAQDEGLLQLFETEKARLASKDAA
jgi:hypothetical protein